MPRGVHSVEESSGPEQDRETGEHVCATLADSGTADQSNCAIYSGKTEPGRSRGDRRSAAFMHGDARGGKTKLDGHHERDAGRVSQKKADTCRVPIARQFAEALISARGKTLGAG